MKKCISMLLVLFLLLGCFAAGIPQAHAASNDSRLIGIVFDNSGSMYGETNQAWCQATYAMEVFASMMNPGDKLLIFPMNNITVDGEEYTSEKPFVVESVTEARRVRDIKTADPSLTPIISLDHAFNYLDKTSGYAKKYLVVLSDGTYFHDHVNGKTQSTDTIEDKELTNRLNSLFTQYTEKMTVMYLGIDKPSNKNKMPLPSLPESEVFACRKTENSAQVLSTLTEMCNMIFGRDIVNENFLPKDCSSIRFDISMGKLILFAQGENITELSIPEIEAAMNGKNGATVRKQETKYSEDAGCKPGNEKWDVDKTLQGMMVTYEFAKDGNSFIDVIEKGDYTIQHNGTVRSVEAYFEPAVALNFKFTDANGNNVDPNRLYEDTYTLSYGLMDAKTAELSDSALLGNQVYTGTCTITHENGEQETIPIKGNKSDDIKINLKKGDTFSASLDAMYLSGYRLHADNNDFGWPTGGITVAPRPVGNLELKISGGQSQYSLQELEEGAPFIAELFYEGNKLSTGDYTLDCVDESASLAAIEKIDKGDHYELKLHYRDAANPQNTGAGDCTVQFKAAYTPQGSNETQAQASLSYEILNDFPPLQISLFAPDDYIVIADLPQSQPIVATLSLRGAKLTAEEFARVPEPIVNTSGIKYTMTAAPEQSAYIIQLLETEGIGEGDYPIQVKAVYTDSVGQVTDDTDELVITLSALPLWLKWVIGLALLLLLIIIIILILRIRVMPGEKYINENRDDCAMSISGMDVSESCDFSARRNGKSLTVKVTYGGADTFGVTMLVEPYKTSFLSKKHPKRSMYVKPDSVRGISDVTFADIAGIAYKLDEGGSLVPDDENQKPFQITNGAEISFRGNVFDAGREQTFSARIPLIFKKR